MPEEKENTTNINNTKHILTTIRDDVWMMHVLREVEKLQLPDWWIGAGFVRSTIWDHLHTYSTRTPLPDIDVIYFEMFNPSEQEIVKIKHQEKAYEAILHKQMPEINWSVKNQSRMHLSHNDMPYKNATEALAQWVETATCVGVKLGANGKLELTAPRGISDLINLKLRPTPAHQKNRKTFTERIGKKQWLTKWPKLKVIS